MLPTAMAFVPPPLPMGWTEHNGPNGLPYYHHAATGQSTYTRPLPAFPVPPPQPPTQKKKEKPLVKTPILGTEWIRVKTTEGNVFYTNKAKKESVWTVPEEIADAVRALEMEEVENEKRVAEHAAETERVQEVERVKREIEKSVKRKADDPVPLDEMVIAKKPRVDDAKEDDEDEEEDEESEEEDWQREAAAQLAAEAEEAEEEKKRLAEEARKAEEEAQAREKENAALKLNMPQKVDLSIEEGKALFKTLLREKDVNPLHPWDTSLPLFISDPRYVLLPSVSARREAFDEYCRDRARELRQAKVHSETAAAVDAKAEFDKLLKDDVTSTRTVWTEWRRKWKKDRRFWGWGRDDREREKRFKEWVRELGEQKRAAAEKAESDFFSLLKECQVVKAYSAWKDVKKEISRDRRYDAVGSSSLREELFNTFLKSLSNNKPATPTVPKPDNSDGKGGDMEIDTEQARKEKKERAVKAREEKVRAELGRVEADIGRSRSGLNKEEDERDFMTMLTDAVRDPQAKWDAVLPQLKTDPRFTRSQLPVNNQLHLFHQHIEQLRSKQINALHALFLAHAPSLATLYSALPLSLLHASAPAVKLGLDDEDDGRLQDEYDRWQRDRTSVARREFDDMLGENSFVEFWGRLGKMGGPGVDGMTEVKVDMDDVGEGGGEEGKVDMKVLAKTVDVREIEKVLKHDKRYVMFDHVPEQRERWVRDYISRLSAPKLSVHVPDHS